MFTADVPFIITSNKKYLFRKNIIPYNKINKSLLGWFEAIKWMTNRTSQPVLLYTRNLYLNTN